MASTAYLPTRLVVEWRYWWFVALSTYCAAKTPCAVYEARAIVPNNQEEAPQLTTCSTSCHWVSARPTVEPLATAVLLGLLLSCRGEQAPQTILDSSPIPGFHDGGVGTAEFYRACPTPLGVRLASDSPFLSVAGTMDLDPSIGLLVTDPIEERLFEFGLDGHLIRSFGSPGTGPGQFLDLADAIFAQHGRVVALDGRGGLTLFDSSGRVLPADVGSGIAGGTMLGRLGPQGLLVGLGAASVRDQAPANLVLTFDLNSRKVLGSYATETRDRMRNFMLFRGVRAGADPAGTITAVSVPYRLGFDLFRPDGRQLGSWQVSSIDYHPPIPHPGPFSSRAEADDWVLNSSYVSYIAMPDTDHILLAWESYPNRAIHRYVSIYSRSSSAFLSVQEVPYRLVRSFGDTLLFLKPTSTPRYDLVLCRTWAPLRDTSTRVSRAASRHMQVHP